jgi:CubicO group peptidase (beta-lactamase class C family)
MQYGYLWWVIHLEKKIYAAIGNSGNVIYVNPEKDTIVAISSYFNPTVFDRIDFIEDTLLPCVGLL